MQPRDKMIICIVPYALSGYMWFSLTDPALVEGRDKDTQLEERLKERSETKAKLQNLQRLRAEIGKLNRDMEELRSSVPKSPDIDLLVIDLEKLALESGLDVVSMKPPEEEKLKKLEQAEKAAAAEEKKQEKDKDKTKPAPVTPGKDKDKEKKDTTSDIGLNKKLLQISLVGDYPNFIELMKKLQSYQRVIGIDHVEIELPIDTRTRSADPSQLHITFLMTAYYLP